MSYSPIRPVEFQYPIAYRAADKPVEMAKIALDLSTVVMIGPVLVTATSAYFTICFSNGTEYNAYMSYAVAPSVEESQLRGALLDKFRTNLVDLWMRRAP